jgi:hypothetical protein
MQTINSNDSSRKSSSKRKQSLSVCFALLSATTSTVNGFSAVRASAQTSRLQLRNDAVPVIRTATELYYQTGNSNTQDEQATANHGVGTWFNDFLKPRAEKDDFEKYADFLGSRYSRLHFEDVCSTKMTGQLGLNDVHSKHKAKQGIVAFNFKEASTILDTKATAMVPTAKKVSQVMFQAQTANMPTSLPASLGNGLAVASSALLKQLQAARTLVKLVVERIQMALSKAFGFALSPVSRDTARRVQTTASLAMACALLMYKPLKGVALAVVTMAREA